MRAPYSPEVRAEVIAAVKVVGAVQPVALAHGIHHATVTRWVRAAKVKLASAKVRARRGGIEGTRRAWGDPAERHARALDMRAGGATLHQIREALGYRSIGTISAILARGR